MSPRRLAVYLLAVAGAAVGVTFAVLVATGESGGSAQPPKRPLVVVASLSPKTHVFGEQITARIDVIADNTRINADSVRLGSQWAPYEPIGDLTVTRRTAGDVTRIRYVVPLGCLTSECVPQLVDKTFHLPKAQVAYVLRKDGKRRTASAAWPRLNLISNLENGEIPRELVPGARGPSGVPEFEVTLPAVSSPTYDVDPALLQIVLLAAAGLLVLAALVLLLPFVRRRAAPVEAAHAPVRLDLSPLERALLGLDWAREHGGPHEQRKALELLSEELELEREDELAEDARALAWSSRPPAGDAAATLSTRVRSLIEVRSNGAS